MNKEGDHLLDSSQVSGGVDDASNTAKDTKMNKAKRNEISPGEKSGDINIKDTDDLDCQVIYTCCCRLQCLKEQGSCECCLQSSEWPDRNSINENNIKPKNVGRSADVWNQVMVAYCRKQEF